jgi:hypothetical protein
MTACTSDRTVSGRAQWLHNLEDVSQLRAAFNHDVGHPRLILLFSPTWGECRAGASWVYDHILKEHPGADVRVFAVWLPMLAGDSRSRWDSGLLPDKRVVQFWDEQLVTGTWFGQHLDEMGAAGQTGGVYWDAFLVFGEDARWRNVPSDLISSGATVIGQSEELQAALVPLL